MKVRSRHEWLRLIGVAILIVGLLAAVAVYWNATRGPDPLLSHGYEIVGGQIFPSAQADMARQRQIERIGGKGAVWAAAFDEWLGSLWQGTRLATTLAILSAIAALVCFHVANLIEEPDAGP
jgi:hypothetical protein